MTVVRLCIRRSSASMIAASVFTSMELVGWSRMRIGASHVDADVEHPAIGHIQHTPADVQEDRVGEVLALPAGLAGTVSGTRGACWGGGLHFAAALPSGSLVALGRKVRVSRVGTKVA
jgi:hypothetical protein